MTSALHAHHPVTACTTVEQLATRWGSDAVSAAPATGEPTLAASALQGLVGLLHGTCGGESAEGEARVAALVAAEQCMAMCPSLIDPAFYRSAACQYTLRCKALGPAEEVACCSGSVWLGAAADGCSAAELPLLSGSLRFIGGLQAHCESGDTLSPSQPVGAALGAAAPALGRALGHQLRGRCDEALVSAVAKTLHWLLSSQCASPELFCSQRLSCRLLGHRVWSG